MLDLSSKQITSGRKGDAKIQDDRTKHHAKEKFRKPMIIGHDIGST